MKKYHLLLLSILSGLLFAVAWPASGITFFVFFAIVPLFFIQQHVAKNREKHGRFAMLLYTYIAYIVWNSLTTYWIWNSTEVGGVLAIGLNAFLLATVFQVYCFTKRVFKLGKIAYLVLIIYWIGFEYFHLDWDLSWPWLNLGNVLATSPKWIQWYEYTGTMGGTLWLIVINILIFETINLFINKGEALKKKLIYSSAALMVIVLPIIFSQIVYSNYKETNNPVDVVVVQPNVDPYNEQYNAPPVTIMNKILALADKKVDSNVRFVVCPESALQEYAYEDQLANVGSVQGIRLFLNSYKNLSFMVGLSTHRVLKPGEPFTDATREYMDSPGKYYEPYNTALLIDKPYTLPIYHKSKLTPGVEKMPFKKLFKPIEKYAIDLGGTIGSLGTDAERKAFPTTVKDIKVSPVICYESIYGEFVSQFVRNGANLLFIITNDGWWGNSPGHRQHFTFATMRAIETRRDIARSANTGISGFINQRGDVIMRTKYWEPDVIRHKMNANSAVTFYVKYGDYIGRFCYYTGLLLLLASILYSITKLKKRLS